MFEQMSLADQNPPQNPPPASDSRSADSQAGLAASAAATGSPPVTGLAAEIGKRTPFQSPRVEAYLNLIRTASLCSADFERLFRTTGLSEATYNVLRILRGSKITDPPGLGEVTCQRIGEQMVSPVPDVTRLVDRLERQGLARRRRCERDRRVVYVSITPQGESLLDSLAPAVDQVHAAHCGHMSEEDLRRLSALLSAFRAGAHSARSVRTGQSTSPSKD